MLLLLLSLLGSLGLLGGGDAGLLVSSVTCTEVGIPRTCRSNGVEAIVRVCNEEPRDRPGM